MNLFKKSPGKRLVAALQKMHEGAEAALDALVDLDDPEVSLVVGRIKLVRLDTTLSRIINDLIGDIEDVREKVEAALRPSATKTKSSPIMLKLKPARGSSLTVSYDTYAVVVGADTDVQYLRLGETAVRTLAATHQDFASAGYRAPEARGRGLALGRTVISKVPQ